MRYTVYTYLSLSDLCFDKKRPRFGRWLSEVEVTQAPGSFNKILTEALARRSNEHYQFMHPAF